MEEVEKARAAMMEAAMFGVLALISGPEASPTSCAATEMIRSIPPRANNAGSLGEGSWWVNADRSLWIGSATGPWHAGYNQKNMMIRPSGVRPTLAGVRIDGSSQPMRVRWVPQLGAEFQTMGLTFASAGCWKITATAGDRTLEFVVSVRPPP